MKTTNYFHRNWFRLAILVLGLGTLAGCSTVQVTEDTVGEFKLGELQTVVNANFGTTYDATKRAFEEHGLFLTGDEQKVIEAELNARDRSDTLITVKLKEVAVGQTSVRIRYGLTGDAARSQMLFRDIARQL